MDTVAVESWIESVHQACSGQRTRVPSVEDKKETEGQESIREKSMKHKHNFKEQIIFFFVRKEQQAKEQSAMSIKPRR